MKPICAQVDHASITLTLIRVVITSAASTAVVAPTNTGDAIYSYSQRAQQLYPHFAWAELQGGTIDIIDEQPGAWSELVARFLKSR